MGSGGPRKRRPISFNVVPVDLEPCVPEAGEDHILKDIQSTERTLREVFRDHKAWGTMIVTGKTDGAYQLEETE